MFDGKLGNYTGSEYKIELLEGAMPYHAIPLPIPKTYKETLKKEVNRLIYIGGLNVKIILSWHLRFLQFLKRMEQFVLFLILENLIRELRGNLFQFLKYKIYY